MPANRTAANAVLRGEIDQAVVGRNQRLCRQGDCLLGSLYGYQIVTKIDNRLVLRHHGFRTQATRRAMIDLLALLGFQDVTVSFAKGAFVVTVNGKTYAASGDKIEVSL